MKTTRRAFLKGLAAIPVIVAFPALARQPKVQPMIIGVDLASSSDETVITLVKSDGLRVGDAISITASNHSNGIYKIKNSSRFGTLEIEPILKRNPRENPQPKLIHNNNWNKLTKRNKRRS